MTLVNKAENVWNDVIDNTFASTIEVKQVSKEGARLSYLVRIAVQLPCKE